MATTFVEVPSLEQQYDLWEAGVLFVRGSPPDVPYLIPYSLSSMQKDDLLRSWERHAKEYPRTKFGYMSEE